MNSFSDQQEKTEKNNKENYSYEIIKTIYDKELFLVTYDLNQTGHKDFYLLKKLIIKSDIEKKLFIQKIDKIKSLSIMHILKIYDYFIEKKEQKETLCILMEYCENGSLEELIKHDEYLNPRNLWRIFIQLILGLYSFHSNNIIVKNLNPKNIFLDKENNIKIFLDFDFNNKPKDFSLMLYDSPEIIRGETYNQKSDIWSLGCVLYELITKKKPFYLIENISKAKYDKGKIINDDFRNLLSKILCNDKKRISLLCQFFKEKIICEKMIEENLFWIENFAYFKNYFFMNSSSLFSNINTFKLDELNQKHFFLYCKKCNNNPTLTLKDTDNVIIECNNCSIKKEEKISNLFNYSSEWITDKKNFIKIDDDNYDNNMYEDLLNINLFKKFLNNAKNIQKNKYDLAYEIATCLQYKITDDSDIKKLIEETIIEIIKQFFKDLKIIIKLISLLKIIIITFKLSSNKNIIKNNYKNIIDNINAFFQKEETEKYKKSILSLKEEYERLSKKIIKDKLYKKYEEERLKKLKQELLQRQKEMREESKLNNININDEKKTNEKINTFLEDMLIYGNIVEKEVKKEKEEHPEKFIETNEALNLEQEDPDLFALGLLSKNLENEGLETVIEREDQIDEDEAGITSLQFLTSGLYKKKRYDLHFDMGEERNEELLMDKKEYEKFKYNLKLKLSKDYNVPIDKIIVTFPQKGSFRVQVIFQSDDFNNLDEQQFLNKFQNDQEFSELKNLKEIHTDSICTICKLSKKWLDKRGNRVTGWGVNEKRGNMPYSPPIGWIGIGLNVMDKYDMGNNTWLGHDGSIGEWCVAYHGVGRFKDSDNIKNIIGSIYNTSFKSGPNQVHANHEDMFHKGKKVGGGVYCTPLIKTAMDYAGKVIIKNKKYYAALMVRVKPNAIRSCKDQSDYWVVNGTTDEIRPYRILYKAC